MNTLIFDIAVIGAGAVAIALGSNPDISFRIDRAPTIGDSAVDSWVAVEEIMGELLL